MELEIPSRLKEARKKLKLNQVEIALELDIQQKSISDIENGKIQNIPNTYIYYFYKKGISLEWLYEGKGSMLTETSVENQISKDSDLNNLFKKLPDQESIIDAEIPVEIKTANLQPVDACFERLIESKEYSIKSLLAYIKSLENTNEYLKGLLNKTLINKILSDK